MTSFQYWQDMAAEADRFICMICFEGFPVVEAFEDSEGVKWDVCTPCGRLEEEYKATASSGPAESTARATVPIERSG